MKRFLAFVLTAVMAGFTYAEEPGAAFLGLSPSVRSEALGSATGLALGAEALGSNPALLKPFTGGSQLFTSFAQLWEDTTYSHVAWATSAGKWGWGAALTHLQTSGSATRDSGGNVISESATDQDTVVTAGFCRPVSRGMRLGLAGKIFQSTLAGIKSDTTWAADAGASLVRGPVLLSAAVNNLGPGQTFRSETDPLPSLLRLDAAWERGPVTMVAGIQQDLPRHRTRFAAGVEYRLGPVALRSGYNADGGSRDHTQKDSIGQTVIDGLAVGLGLSIGQRLRFDYSLRQSGPTYGNLHRAALSWSWGAPAVKPSPPGKTQPPPKRSGLHLQQKKKPAQPATPLRLGK